MADQGEIVTIGGEKKYWIADRRIFWDREKQELVEEGDPKAAFLYCAPFDRVPLDFAEKHNLVPEPKSKPKAPNKEKKASANKAKKETAKKK